MSELMIELRGVSKTYGEGAARVQALDRVDLRIEAGEFVSEMGPSGEMIWRTDRDRPTPGQPAVVELRAEMNCLVALSLCPEITLGRGARVEIHRD